MKALGTQLINNVIYKAINEQIKSSGAKQSTFAMMMHGFLTLTGSKYKLDNPPVNDPRQFEYVVFGASVWARWVYPVIDVWLNAAQYDPAKTNFGTDHEILSQNAEALRSQLVTPAANAQLVAREAVELLAWQSADQIYLWTYATTQTQLEDYTIRSHLLADLIHRLAAPILETGLSADASNINKIQHDLQIQHIIALQLII
ncbi:MAG: hypothetical protein EZS28_023322 [Streblomastix strix]|uniref:Uncharacterized protein n=1 Tax=Streblomastix strix TaxID=222440 RepID=A0A5J4VFI1_9EUKA|nr:MAG: hypothetical protein EZS28_023322 [Streblomastix strix]